LQEEYSYSQYQHYLYPLNDQYKKIYLCYLLEISSQIVKEVY